MNSDIVRCILYESLSDNIRSIKNLSLISKQWSAYISNLSTKDNIKDKLDIVHQYIDKPNKCMKIAAKYGHMDIVLFMIELKQSTPRATDWGANYWNIAMVNAAAGGHMNIVKLMIGKGANDWNYAMVCAAYGGHMDIVQFMIEEGAHIWDWAMACAAEGGHMDIVQFMIKLNQSTPQVTDWVANNWNQAMAGAANGGHMNIVRLMIEKGADDWNAGLSCATRNGHNDIIELMIEKGADN